MHGVLNFLKPPGMTSHNAVAFIRRVAGVKRVGHTGTLDPAAAGVLPICIGQATRLVEYLQEGNKEYIAEATFGYETDTLDAVGRVVREASAADVAEEPLRAALKSFEGTIDQVPPIYSAIKVGGQKLYQKARAGADADEVPIDARRVTIHRAELLRLTPATSAPPRAFLRIECSGGTYIRSLVRDLGVALDSAATMTFLVRTRSGNFSIDDATTPEELLTDLESHLLPLNQILPLCVDAVIQDDALALKLAQGQVVSLTSSGINSQIAPSIRVAVTNTLGTIAAVAVPQPRGTALADGYYRAEKVLNLETGAES
jgi:tRNA pseudouridine55 synthase